MSRVGKNPVIIPDKCEVHLSGNVFSVQIGNNKFTDELTFLSLVDVEIKDQSITVRPKNDTSKASRQAWGTTRALIANMVSGVQKPFEKRLILKGVGYRVAVASGVVTLQLGFSHDVKYKIPDGIDIKVEDGILVVSGISKAKVGQVASEIRDFRPPEPYKGKGVRYVDEIVLLKDGKKK